jgi:hypothetical protein
LADIFHLRELLVGLPLTPQISTFLANSILAAIAKKSCG